MAKKEPRELDTLFPYVPILQPGEHIIDEVLNDPRTSEEKDADLEKWYAEMEEERKRVQAEIAEMAKQGKYVTTTIAPPPKKKKR